MTDDRHVARETDRIDSMNPEAMRDWAKRLRISETELKEVIMQVGNSVDAVRDKVRRGGTR